MDNNQHIGKLLQKKRLRRSHTKDVAASALRISGACVRLWEEGKSLPQQRQLPALAKYLGVSVGCLTRKRRAMLVVALTRRLAALKTGKGA